MTKSKFFDKIKKNLPTNEQWKENVKEDLKKHEDIENENVSAIKSKDKHFLGNEKNIQNQR